MTLSEPTDNPTLTPAAAVAAAPDLDLSALLAGAAGDLAVPPDLVHRVARYNEALGVARSIAATVARIYLPELEEMRDLISRAHGEVALFLPGGALYEHTVALEILGGVADIVTEAGDHEAAARNGVPL